MKAVQPMSEVHEPTWRLGAGAVQRLAPSRRARWLQPVAGRLWLTRTGSGPAREADVWLQPGQRLWLAPGSDWLIEGWGAAAFEVLEVPAARPAAPAAPKAASARGFPWPRPAASSS